MMLVVDLLHAEPALRLDKPALSQTLTFAFAAGGGSDAFARVMSRPLLDPSNWNADCFALDLFLEDFVKLCIGKTTGGATRTFSQQALRLLLTQPPRDPSTVKLRQGVLAELAQSPRLVEACQETWSQIDRVRTIIESAELGKRTGAIHRRVEILRQTAQVFEFLLTAFDGAASALGRIGEFARQVADSDGYHHLREFLDYEGHLATVDLRVRVGQDGEIRSFDIVKATENADNEHYRNPLARLWARILMLFRGYAIREREVVGRLVEAVFDGIELALMNLLQLGLQLEFYLAALRFRQLAEQRGLEVSLPELVPLGASDGGTRFERLFNPFLLEEERPPVPCDLAIGETEFVMVTGPNSGGKTRLLQAVALAQLLAQSGFYAPAKRARLAWRNGLFVALVHQVSADQREGHLGSELVRIRRLFERIGFGDLVLLDELCSGTNPSEGEEIAQLVISLLYRLSPQAYITTHFLEFAARLAKQPPVPGLHFLQVELDERLRPLYRFVPGVASTSLAAQTAERLGVTREALEALIAEKTAARTLQASLAPPPPRPEDRAERDA
jgi:DNA mismatch repair protein MutS2